MSTIDRLRHESRDALREAGISQAAASRALGISQKHVSQLLTGRVSFTLEWAEKLLALAGKRVSFHVVSVDLPDGEAAMVGHLARQDREIQRLQALVHATSSDTVGYLERIEYLEDVIERTRNALRKAEEASRTS